MRLDDGLHQFVIIRYGGAGRGQEDFHLGAGQFFVGVDSVRDDPAHFVIDLDRHHAGDGPDVHVDAAVVRGPGAAPGPASFDGRDVYTGLEFAYTVALAVTGDPVVDGVQDLAGLVDRVGLHLGPRGMDQAPRHGDLEPGGAAVARDQHHVGGFAQDAEIGHCAVGNRKLGAHAVALVLPALEVVHRRFLYLAGHARDDHVPGQLDAGLADRLRGDDVRPHGALHVERPHAVDPLVIDQGGLALVTDAAVGLFRAKRRVQVAVEHQGLAAALPLQAADGVVTVVADGLQGGVKTGRAENLVQGAGNAFLFTGGTGDVHQVHDEFYQPLPVDVVDGFGE